MPLKTTDVVFYVKVLLVGLIVSAIYWILESIIHVYFFHIGDLQSQLFPSDNNELCMRFLIVFLLTAVLVSSSFFLKKQIALSKSLLLFKQVLLAIREACIITNSKNEIIYINPRYEQITGYTLDEVLGKNPSIASSGKQDKAFYEKLWSSLIEHGYWEGEIWNRNKAGLLYPEWISISAIRNNHEKIEHYVGIFTDITSQKALQEKISHSAYYDPLTNLPNRRFFLEQLKQEMLIADRRKEKIGLLFLDLDRFKKINDEYNHLMGDLFLCFFSGEVKKIFRKSDVLSRFGGDEFVLLLPNIQSKENLYKTAINLLSHFDKTAIDIENHSFKIRCSIGGALYPDDANDSETLIQLADQAMYVVKRASGHNINVYSYVRPG